MGLLSALGRVGRRAQGASPTRIYRGIVPSQARHNATLGDRWWSTSPEVASTYAPGEAEGAHVLLGAINEDAMRILNIEPPPGTMFRAIPVKSLPPQLRRAFPRSTETVSTHEVAAAAEALGYQGVSFRGIRDSGYGGGTESYGGFGAGDPGRVLALFDDQVVQNPLLQRANARPR